MKAKLVLLMAVVLGLGVLFACGGEDFGCGDICDIGKGLCDWGDDTTCADSCGPEWDAAPEAEKAAYETCFSQASTCEEFMACMQEAPEDGDEDSTEE
jgi:hypothetical protein